MKIRNRLLLIIVFTAFLMVPCCRITTVPSGKLVVGVTILPQVEFVEKLAGKRVETVLMVPPGASPHTYEPTPRQLEALSRAAVYFSVGSGVEFELKWMEKLAKINPQMKVVSCAVGISLLDMTAEDPDGEHPAGGKDPHIWLSPGNVKIIVENIAKGLSRADSANEKEYQANREAFLREIDGLDRQIRVALKTDKGKKFIVYHPAWGYFARDYGLEQIPVEAEGKEPSPAQIKRLIDTAKKDSIKLIFVSPEYSTKSAKLIAHETGGTTIAISPNDKAWTENMKKIAELIAKR